MLTLGANTFIVGAFQFKHYFRLQLVPHITKYTQWWRILSYQAAFQSSSELFISQIILYNVSVALERVYGSRKFSSYIFVSGVVSTTMTVLGMLAAGWFGINTSFAGPIPILFSILYSYYRVIPSAYRYRIFGVSLTDKTPYYVMATFLALINAPESIALATIGILTGAACRSDILPFKSYRLPSWINKVASAFRPLIGSTEPGYRPNSVLPELGQSGTHVPTSSNGEAIGSAGVDIAEPSVMNRSPVEAQNQTTGREPTSEEISQLSAMFPEATRVQIVNAISSTSSLEAAVERLVQ